MADDVKPITFGGKELDPREEAAYKERIKTAKASGSIHGLKSKEPVGVVPRPSIPMTDRVVDTPTGLTAEGGVAPRPAGSPLLSAQTATMLQEAAAAAAQQAAQVKVEEKVEEKKVSDEDLFEMFDFDKKSEAERILNNKKRRKEIEGRCAPMNISDLVMKEEVRQVIPIIPGQFEVTFRSMTPEESLFIKQFIAKRDQGQSDQYLLEKFSLCQLTCSLVALNGRDLPDHRDQQGSPTEPLFEAKLKMITKKSAYVMADLGLNYMWFDIRVRKLLAGDALGNG